MKEQLNIILLVLLILFIIYLFIKNSNVCSIVRNEKEEFNVGVGLWDYTKHHAGKFKRTLERNKEKIALGTVAAAGTLYAGKKLYDSRSDSDTIEQCYAYCDKAEDSKPVKRYPPSADHKQCYELCAAFHLDP